MNFLTQVSLVSIPAWSRWLIAILIITGLCIGIFIFIDAVTGETNEDAASASAYLLGIVMPITIVGIIFLTAYAGEKNLTNRTEDFLTYTLPMALRFIQHCPLVYRDVRDCLPSPKPKSDELSQVLVSHQSGRCTANYQINIPRTGSLVFLCEINVHRANLTIGLPGAKNDSNTSEVINALRHSLGMDSVDDHFARREGAVFGAQSQYEFSSVLIQRDFGRGNILALCCSRNLATDFLWNAAERLFLAQDLTIMLRAFLKDWPEGMLEPKSQYNTEIR